MLLARTLGLRPDTQGNLDTTCGGLLDIAFHFAGALLVLSHRGGSDQYNDSGPCPRLRGALTYERVVRGLGLAFTLEDTVVRHVLGEPDRFSLKSRWLDFTHDLFPQMVWVPHEKVCESTVRLWYSACEAMPMTPKYLGDAYSSEKESRHSLMGILSSTASPLLSNTGRKEDHGDADHGLKRGHEAQLEHSPRVQKRLKQSMDSSQFPLMNC